MPKININKLQLYNYRNFKDYLLELEPKSHTIITGPNGSGKTNILESLSFLTPGKGLRSARYEDISHNGSGDWQVNVIANTDGLPIEIATSYIASTQKRKIEINGAKALNADLIKCFNIAWITPQLEDVFLATTKKRRQYLDRMAYSFTHDHATNINKYDYYLAERMKILQESYDTRWLDIIESKMAEYAAKIIQARLYAISLLESEIPQIDICFPKISLAMDNIEHDVTDFSHLLKNNRSQDRIAKRTCVGPHRSDFIVFNLDKNQHAKQCSTGEQKAMCITILLSYVNALSKANQDIATIMLLDEIFTHLDSSRKNSLVEFIINTQSQCWITSTDYDGLEKLIPCSNVINLLS